MTPQLPTPDSSVVQAYAMQSGTAEAAYQDFLTLWKDTKRRHKRSTDIDTSPRKA